MPERGQVKWFDPKKGYGFIYGPDNQDVFVHYSHIQGQGFRSLADGEEVSYELVESDKGWQARGVVRNEESVASGESDGEGYPRSPATAGDSRGYSNSLRSA